MVETERLDTEAMPLTERFTPTFDTGVLHKVEPELIEPAAPVKRRRFWQRRSEPAEDVERVEPSSEVPLTDETPVPGHILFIKWWQLLLMLLAVWIPAGGVGAGLFYWWSHDASRHKTPVVFAVLVFVVVTIVAGLILAMVPHRPFVSALSIAMISAVFAAVLGAAPVYGKFYCDHSQRHCVMRVIPL